MSRSASLTRDTAETKIELSFNLDGTGNCSIDSGCGFLNHMLTLLARHGNFDLTVCCNGDKDVDYHHTTEDVAICLGRALRNALGDYRGIRRYGNMLMPMDEALILCAVDLSGRAGFYHELMIPTEKVGDFDTELCTEFFYALVREAGITLHLRQLSGINSHHIIEGCFKAFARAMREAVSVDPQNADRIPSSKGVLG